MGGRGACWVCARSSHRRHRAGLGLLGIGIFFAGFSVPKDPGSSVRTSGPKLTVAYSFKWSLVDRQTSTAKFQNFALLCIFFKDLTVVNGWWAYTQFFTPPFDVLSDLVVFGAYFQVAHVDDSLFACRLFAGDESPELVIFVFVSIVRVPLRLFSSPASVGLRAGRVSLCFFVTRDNGSCTFLLGDLPRACSFCTYSGLGIQTEVRIRVPFG